MGRLCVATARAPVGENGLDSVSERVVEAERPRVSAAPDEAALWTNFAEAESLSAYCRAWLALQCAAITGAKAALLLIDDEGSFAPAAIWPRLDADVGYLKRAAEQTLQKRAGVALHVGDDREAGSQAHASDVHIGYPVVVRDRLYGAVVVHVNAPGPEEIKAVWRRLHWGVGWLEALFWRTQARQLESRSERLTIALDTLAATQEPPSAQAAALACANELTLRLGCDRVALGWRRGGALRVRVISHATRVERKAKFIDALANAMDEALDQRASLAMPALPETEPRVAVALRSLAKMHGHASALAVVMPGREGAFGVILALRREGAPFEADTLRLAESAALLVGPFLEQKAAGERWLAGRIPDGIAFGWRAVFGPRHAGIKLAALAACLAFCLLLLSDGPDRVSAKSVLEASVQRAAVAPFDGFIAEAAVRAGDIVKEGDLLAKLDDKDLLLDQQKWQTEKDKAVQKMRESSAEHERAEFAAHAAEAREAETQLALAEDRISRARIASPIDGLVVSGDLTQLLGSPVERGKTLFEIAPLSTYRVVLQVNERDVRRVAVGQTGKLLLAGLPDRPLPITVAAHHTGRDFGGRPQLLSRRGRPRREAGSVAAGHGGGRQDRTRPRRPDPDLDAQFDRLVEAPVVDLETAVNQPFLSPSWYRLADLRPRLRADVEVSRQRYRGRTWYALYDPVAGSTHRVSLAAYLFIGRLDGRRTVQEIFDQISAEPDAPAFGQGDIVKLLTQLHANELLLSDAAPDVTLLEDARLRRKRSAVFSQLRNPLSIKLPLLNPTRWLNLTSGLFTPCFSRLGFFVWLAIVIAGIVAAVSHSVELSQDVLDRAFSFANLPLLAVAYIVVKSVHELGHAYAVKAFGGEVREIGVMALVFFFVPYVDASASNAFRSKWRRATVAATGVAVELMLAALAALAWTRVEPGLARAFLYDVMLIGGVSTLVFNGNPLMRFDGYYVLCDLTETPNLGQRATAFWGRLAERRLLGLPQPEPQDLTAGERWLFLLYAPLSWLYRTFVLLGLGLLLMSQFFVFGVLLAIWSLGDRPRRAACSDRHAGRDGSKAKAQAGARAGASGRRVGRRYARHRFRPGAAARDYRGRRLAAVRQFGQGRRGRFHSFSDGRARRAGEDRRSAARCHGPRMEGRNRRPSRASRRAGRALQGRPFRRPGTGADRISGTRA